MKTISIVLLAIIAFGSAPYVLGASGETSGEKSGEVDRSKYDAAKEKAKKDKDDFVTNSNKYRSDIYAAQTVIITQLEELQTTMATSVQSSSAFFLISIGGGFAVQQLKTMVTAMKLNREVSDAALATVIQAQAATQSTFIATVEASANFAFTQVQVDLLTATLTTFSAAVTSMNAASSSYDITTIQASYTSASAKTVKASQDIIAAINSKNAFAYGIANTVLMAQALVLPAAIVTITGSFNLAFQTGFSSVAKIVVPIFTSPL